MLNKRKIIAFASALTLVTGLAACGSSDDDDDGGALPSPPPTTPPSSEVPPSAGASVAAFIAFLQTLVASSSETAEPLSVGSFTALADDTAEPQPL